MLADGSMKDDVKVPETDKGKEIQDNFDNIADGKSVSKFAPLPSLPR